MITLNSNIKQKKIDLDSDYYYLDSDPDTDDIIEQKNIHTDRNLI